MTPITTRLSLCGLLLLAALGGAMNTRSPLLRVLCSLAAFCTGFCAGALAAPPETPVVSLQGEPLTLKPGLWGVRPVTTDFTFDLPAHSPPNTALALSLDARMDSPPVGSMYFLYLTVNGQTVEIARDRLFLRLLNKPLTVQKDDPGFAWGEYGNALRVVYSPSFDAPVDGVYGDQPYHSLLDIGDLLRPGRNTVGIARKEGLNEVPMVVRNLRLVTTPAPPRPAPFRIAGPPVTPIFSIAPDGSLVAHVGRTSLPIISEFSVPGGGWQRLGPAGADDRSRIVPGRPVVRNGVVTLRVSGTGGQYALRRVVTVGRGHARIADTFTNLTGHDLGVMADHALRTPGKLAQALIEGKSNPALFAYSSPARPTASFALGASLVTLLADDDVFRQQAIEYCRPDLLGGGLRTERLLLAPHRSVSLRWSVYSVAGGDEFDVVNRIRRDWRVAPVTVPGAYWQASIKEVQSLGDAEFRDMIARTGIRFIEPRVGETDGAPTPGTPRPIAFGMDVMDGHWAPDRDAASALSKRIHALTPGVRVDFYTHYFLNGPDIGAYPDSWIIKADGGPHLVSWGADLTPSRGVLPTLTDTDGIAYPKMLRAFLRGVGCDGFMFDETVGPTGLWDALGAHGMVDFSRPDGYSAAIDPDTFAVKQKVGYLKLLSAPWERALLRGLKADGISAFANGYPAMGWEGRDGFLIRQVEAGQGEDAVRQNFSGTPVGLVNGNYDVWQLRRDLAHGCVVWSATPGDHLYIVGHFFPLTVTDLHRGWVRARERVIVSATGRYGWPGETFRCRAWAWDKDGKIVDAAPRWRQGAGLVPVNVPPDGIAILERG